MTFSLRNLVGLATFLQETQKGHNAQQTATTQRLSEFYDFFIGCHVAHGVDFAATLSYMLLLHSKVTAAFSRGSNLEVVTMYACWRCC